MFRATTNCNEEFERWLLASGQEFEPKTKSMLRRAHAQGWNTAVQSFLPRNAQHQASASLRQEIDQVFGTLQNEPDRSVAIVACAFIEEALGVAIQAAFVEHDSVLQMLDGQFRSYASRAKLAFCLGFFGEESRMDLAALGDVRNRFAHRRAVLSFQEPWISQKCRNLMTVKAIQGWTETDPRICFITAANVIMLMLVHRASGEPQRLTHGNWWEG